MMPGAEEMLRRMVRQAVQQGIAEGLELAGYPRSRPHLEVLAGGRVASQGPRRRSVEGPPIVPPPAGSWIRERQHPRTDRRRPAFLGPASAQWRSAWHLATGDLWVAAFGGRFATARCGRQVMLDLGRPPGDGRSKWDHVVADEMPGVDACGNCRRLAGPAVPA